MGTVLRLATIYSIRMQQHCHSKRATCFYWFVFFWGWKQVTGQATSKYQGDNIKQSWWIFDDFRRSLVLRLSHVSLTIRTFLVYKSWPALSTWTWRHSPVPGDGWVHGTFLWAGAGTLKLIQNLQEKKKLEVKEGQRQSNAKHTSPISSLLEGTCRCCTLQFSMPNFYTQWQRHAEKVPAPAAQQLSAVFWDQCATGERRISGLLLEFLTCMPLAAAKNAQLFYFFFGGVVVWTWEICWDWTTFPSHKQRGATVAVLRGLTTGSCCTTLDKAQLAAIVRFSGLTDLSW